MRVELRIVAGSLRRRKLVCVVNPNLRPTPLMVREALFSILGNAVPGRTFFDVFAGTGINGLEALSRGASAAVFIERDFRLGQDIENNLRQFGLGRQGRVYRADAYRWAESWQAPPEPATLFVSPPFADYQDRLDELLRLVGELQRKGAPGSVLALQSERQAGLEQLPGLEQWDRRRYGRNELLFWVKEPTATSPPAE